MNRFDLNLLTVFDAVFRDGSVTRAADRLHLTQPAISHALGRLRALFDDPLFVRSGRNLVPTPFARSVADDVQRALRMLHAAVNHKGHFDPAAASHSFTIGVRDVLEAAVLPPLLESLQALGPQIGVVSRHVDRSTLVTELASGLVDVAVDVLLDVPGEVLMQSYAEERLCVVARQQHPAIRGVLDLDTYLAADHVIVSRRRHGRAFEDVELSRLGLTRTIKVRCQHYFAACRVAAASDLIVTMPERYAGILNQGQSNQLLPIPFESAPMDMYLYWHRSADDDPGNRWLRGQLLQAIEAEPVPQRPG